MTQKITFRALIEVAGKPKEHVENSLKGYLEKLKDDPRYVAKTLNQAETKQHESDEVWATFSEVEVETENINNLIHFGIEYMPSAIEIISPDKISFSNVEFTEYLNDLQSKLHGFDMIAKQKNFEHEGMKKNMNGLLTNYIAVLLRSNKLTADQLSEFTGINIDMLGDFLDKLIDEGKIDLKDGIYYLTKQVA